MTGSRLLQSRISNLSRIDKTKVKSNAILSRLNTLPSIEPANYDPTDDQEEYMRHLDAKYVGQMYDYKSNGYGKLYFDNGDFLEGDFKDGRCEGKGRWIKSDGSYYEGDFKNNVADGHGKYFDVNGYKYEGQWKNNLPNGKG